MQEQRPRVAGEEIEGSDVGGGRGAVAVYAPRAAAALDALEAVVWQRLDANLVDLAARVCASLHGIPALARPVDLGPGPWASREVSAWRSFGELSDAQLVAIEFAEQFGLDVSAVSDELRAALLRAYGDAAAVVGHAIYVADVIPRARFVLDRLFGASAAAVPTSRPRVDPDATIWTAIEELIRVVPGLQGLDAITTELVRLRGARQHQCRLCQSLRSRSALAAGAADDTFAAIDAYVTSDLPDAVKAALAVTDTFIWTPGRLSDEEVAGLRKHFSPAQQVELVLDITRNATNKFAVSLAADAANVSEGYEIYEVAADGSIRYGLSHP
jgi:alkylhydroperoxidase family enzyme